MKLKEGFMKLYDYLPSGNSYKIRLLFAYLNIEYEWVNLDIIQGLSLIHI